MPSIPRLCTVEADLNSSEKADQRHQAQDLKVKRRELTAVTQRRALCLICLLHDWYDEKSRWF